MSNKDWASLEDFAVLFGYFWHRDFPVDPEHVGANISDWTKHIDHIIGSISDLMGLYVRHEVGGKIDAIIFNSSKHDLVALEWESQSNPSKWNEVGKLRDYLKNAFKNTNREEYPKYGVFISYTLDDDKEKERALLHLEEQWAEVPRPLLFIQIVYKESSSPAKRDLKDINMYIFDRGSKSHLRTISALPWEVPGHKMTCLKEAGWDKVIKEYIEATLIKAKYELIDNNDEPHYGEIPELKGVWATGKSQEECKNNLVDVLEGWIALRFKRIGTSTNIET